ncbi:helix-turn-helix domain-containing protein [Methylococcus capsulatus]|uniref:helix-turn-helix domain-containing protein n=1 Tax=Methylococcus capsulatus TaxID=414 RepID=UPI001C52B55B|nr:helix-turn-helix domain-containing protein [Methylococcus capsulatus]QXP90026.1 helix-turn-helix domain-containing protein [Methylococcus capsulatus]
MATPTQNLELPRLLTDVEAAQYLGQSVRTLATWRCTGRHNLPYTKIGRKPFYRVEDLARFVEKNARGMQA